MMFWRTTGYQWAELMRRTFGIDLLACPRCGGRLRLVALIDQAFVIERNLATPRDAHARPRAATGTGAPPRQLDFTDDQSQDGPEFDAAW
jgi:hypothetical protein